MTFWDYLIIVIPVLGLLALSFYCKRYVRGVVDYLAAGRVAGRYVIAVGDMTTGLSVISLVALVEAKYQTGYGIVFWENILAPVGIVLSLTGYCVYRYRQTKSLSIGQFLEMRYSRSFRIFAAIVRTFSEMVTNAVGPAIAANFFLYFLGLPHEIMIWNVPIPCFVLVVAMVIILALLILLPGGRIALLITDCVQGLLGYPIFVIITGYILLNFSWYDQIAPTMLNRVPGESFLNPFDIDQLRDFNIFALVVSIVSQIINRASWIGNDTSSSGRTPHEQKMAGILGAWRNGFASLMCMTVAIAVITAMNHPDFAAFARETRLSLSSRAADEAIPDPALRRKVMDKLEKLPAQEAKTPPEKFSRENNPDTPFLNTAREAITAEADLNIAAAAAAGNSIDPAKEIGKANKSFQNFRSLYNQMMISKVMSKLFPAGMLGLFCLLMLLLLLSTDDSRIFNSSATLVQDVIMPLRGKPFTREEHLKYLRWCTLGAGIFFFGCSILFVQLDYINMFITIISAIWLGGAGPVMIFGLYSRFGTTLGAYASIITGSGISAAGMLCQQLWPGTIFPFLKSRQLDGALDNILQILSSPFNPYIVWEVTPEKFPLNSYEIFFIAMMGGLAAYIIFSLLSRGEPFDLDRMLHRGKYAENGSEVIAEKWTFRNVLSKLIGITPEYTRGDRIIAWSVFFYSIVYQIGLCFFAVLIWNIISPWPAHWWSHYFFYVSLVGGAIAGVVSTVWFIWGGIIDIRRLFRDLAARRDDPTDDGWVDKSKEA